MNPALTRGNRRPPTAHVLARFTHQVRTVACLLGLVAAAVCSSGAEAKKPDTEVFEFALYFSPRPAVDPINELGRLLVDRKLRLRLADQADFSEAVAMVSAHWVPLADYAPPSAESLRYSGVGVAPTEAQKFVTADRVLILDFAASPRGVLVANRSACLLMASLAKATQGTIWDEETRQIYSLERWQADRIETWQGGLPDMSKHVTMHAYANPELIRIITLGMRKFGLPDLVVTEIPSHQTRPLGNFINAFMQSLVEGQRPVGSRMKLILAEIRHPAAKSRALESPAEGAKGSVMVSTRAVALEPGDAKNILWQLDFPESKLEGITERALWGAGELFGSNDKIVGAPKGDPELEDAKTRARKAFFAQEARFRAGLALNEHLMVKAPFAGNGQTEYMWVEVTKWAPKEVQGVLNNDPFYIKDLHSGAHVTVSLDEIYDYLLYRADGSQEGNETGKVLERRERK